MSDPRTTYTYHGNGRVTASQTSEVLEDVDLEMSEEEADEDPLYAAIVRHVVRKVEEEELL